MIKILQILAFLSAVFAAIDASAGDSGQSTQVTQPVRGLFDAMRAHDSVNIQAQFTDNARLLRVDEQGLVRDTDISAFAQSIAKHQSYLDEQLLAVDTQVSGTLASVWTPFAFYVDGKLSHCGVNSFQLVKTPKGWRIQNLMDVTHQGDCQAFIAKYKL